MARFRLSKPAQADLANLLSTSTERWGPDGRRRYSALLAKAIRKVAADPQGRGTRDRADLSPGLRGFRTRYAGDDISEGKVKRPVHIICYRMVQPGLIEIVRVLHERMEPGLHLGGDA